MERLVKGIHVIPLHDFIKENYDEDTRNGIYERMGEPAREMLRSIKREDWVPFGTVGSVTDALFQASADQEHAYQDIVRAGAAIADYATNTYVRLLIKLMTPKIMASKWPDIWKKSHNFGLMQCQLENDRMLRMTLSGVADYAHIGPIAVGFLTFALKAMNMADATVVQVQDRYVEHHAERYEFPYHLVEQRNLVELRAEQSAAMKTIHAQLLDIMMNDISGINARSLIGRALEKSGGGNAVDAKNVADVVMRLEAASQLFVQPWQHAEMVSRIRALSSQGASESHKQTLIRVVAESDIVVARTRARETCEALNASVTTAHKIATVVSELARNIVSYTKGGQIELIPFAQPRSLLVLATDNGPGIRNLDEILQGHYKSNTGLGIGLAGTKRLAQSFMVKTGFAGTRIEAGFAL